MCACGARALSCGAAGGLDELLITSLRPLQSDKFESCAAAASLVVDCGEPEIDAARSLYGCQPASLLARTLRRRNPLKLIQLRTMSAPHSSQPPARHTAAPNYQSFRHCIVLASHSALRERRAASSQRGTREVGTIGSVGLGTGEKMQPHTRPCLLLLNWNCKENCLATQTLISLPPNGKIGERLHSTRLSFLQTCASLCQTRIV